MSPIDIQMPLSTHPRDVRILFYGPLLAHILDQADWLHAEKRATSCVEEPILVHARTNLPVRLSTACMYLAGSLSPKND